MNAGWARRAALAGALASGVACAPREPGRAGDRVGGSVDVVRVIVVAPAPGAPAALYASLTNATGRPDSLLGLSTPAADSATLHTQQSRGAMAVMQPVVGVRIPAGGVVRLSPGRLHGMLGALRAPLTPGDSVPVTFRFAVSDPVTVAARVVAYTQLGRALERAGHEEP